MFFNFWNNIDSLKTLSTYFQWISITLVFLSGFLAIGKHVIEKKGKDLANRDSYATNWQNNAKSLKTLGNIFQMVSIIFIFLGGFLVYGKYKIDGREKYLSIQVQTIKDGQLQNKVGDLESELTKKQIEIDKLNRKTEMVNPYEAPIRTGTVTIDIQVAQKDHPFVFNKGYITFNIGTVSIMKMISDGSMDIQPNNNGVNYHGVLYLDATDDSIGKPVNFLKNTENVQIAFFPLYKNCKVISGKATCILNSSVTFKILIPPQEMDNDYITVSDIKYAFLDFINKN